MWSFLLLGVRALPISAAQEAGVLHFPLKASLREVGIPGEARGNGKRQIELDVTTQLQGTVYSIDIVVGTPGQTVSVDFDTGSEELWANSTSSKASSPALCQERGRLTSNTSFTDLPTLGGRQHEDGYVVSGFDTVGAPVPTAYPSQSAESQPGAPPSDETESPVLVPTESVPTTPPPPVATAGAQKLFLNSSLIAWIMALAFFV